MKPYDKFRSPTFSIDYIECPNCYSKGKIFYKDGKIDGVEWRKAE
jgi:hypothetical protein